MKYYVNGRPVRESTGTEDHAKAKRLMKEREGRVAVGDANSAARGSYPL
jgi:hypothetical protein